MHEGHWPQHIQGSQVHKAEKQQAGIPLWYSVGLFGYLEPCQRAIPATNRNIRLVSSKLSADGFNAAENGLLSFYDSIKIAMLKIYKIMQRYPRKSVVF
jgi:hypothetical protein